jgi:large-conductance mechanosensitive channel
MFSLEQKNTIYKILMLIFAFGGLMSLAFNIILIHQYAHAVNILVEHMRVIHNTEITSKEIKNYIQEKENRELNSVKEIKQIIKDKNKTDEGEE